MLWVCLVTLCSYLLVQVTAKEGFQSGLTRQNIRISPSRVYDQFFGDYVEISDDETTSNSLNSAYSVYSQQYIPLSPIEFNFSVDYSTQNTSNVPFYEYQALQEIYDTMNGEHWEWDFHLSKSTHWNFTGPQHNPCVEKWQALTCICKNTTTTATLEEINNTTDCNIHALLLFQYNLQGSIPASVGNFSNITWIDMSKNTITGEESRLCVTLHCYVMMCVV